MEMAIIAFVLSAGIGGWLSFFNQGMGVVAAVSIMGAFLVTRSTEKSDRSQTRIHWEHGAVRAVLL